ncbi:MAG: CPBP family intramembrane metalloprotease [Lachnospiraceae bacterium]|nr:CPBP family intramembrane metalloprotease [Lachnospiraceae bacterium]
MNAKRAGWAFLWMVVVFITASILVSALLPDLSIGVTALFSELCLLVPALVQLSKARAQVSEQLHLKGIRLSTALMVLVYHVCCYPVILAMNSFTMAISDNTALDITDQFGDVSFFVMWFFVGLLGPVVEELVFRGIILGGLRTTGRIFSAIVLSALLFGLAHMNINQFSYTLCVGIFWGLLVEATGSIVPSLICHVMMNSVSVMMAFLLEKSYGELDGMMEVSGMESAVSYLATGFFFLFISIFTTMLAMLMLRVISLNEGRTGCFENIFRKKSRAERLGSLFSVPLIAGIAVSGFVTVFVFILNLLW